jgi:hypothetical protein
MSDPGRRGEHGADPTAEHAQPRPRAGESTRRQPTVDQGAGPYDHAEAQLGGADAVEKTTYVVGEGTEPDARPRGDYIARGAARGASLGVWIIGGVAVLIALVYAIGIFG